MKHETSATLHGYWLGCHHETGVPAGNVSAVDLAPILPSLFLVDLAPSKEPRFRFCGAAIAMRYGRDLTDESFLALWNPEDRATLGQDMRSGRSRFTGLVAGVMAETLGGGFTAFEMLLLPLAGEKGTAGAIGSMARIGGHEELNRIRARIVGQWLRSVRFLPPARSAAAFPDILPVPLSPPATAKTERRYGHLTVVTGGR